MYQMPIIVQFCQTDYNISVLQVLKVKTLWLGPSRHWGWREEKSRYSLPGFIATLEGQNVDSVLLTTTHITHSARFTMESLVWSSRFRRMVKGVPMTFSNWLKWAEKQLNGAVGRKTASQMNNMTHAMDGISTNLQITKLFLMDPSTWKSGISWPNVQNL